MGGFTFNDYIVRATAAGGQVRAFAATTKDTAEWASRKHRLSPVAAAALGRLMAGGTMMGIMMKGDKNLLTLHVRGDGPMQGLTVTADSHGNVKGYVLNPDVDIPLKAKGKLDVGGAIGNGILSVIKDLGLKEPYNGQINLQTGEIAEDLTYYFATSEQTPSVVGLGVLVNTDNSIRQAGGFIIQLMPDCSEKVICKIEEKLATLDSVTNMFEAGKTPEDILEIILGDQNLEINEKIDTQFYCNCSKDRVAKALISIGKEELQSMIDEGNDIVLNCHFCNTNYTFTVDELKELYEQSR